jgi:formylglycine-generating enzyme required for sulfatase activity/dienelactone hydrolase
MMPGDAAMTGTVGHYEILEKLGEGGMGVVYKARDTRLGRFVALKFLSSNVGPDDIERARFLQEARAASSLDHPNICTIYDIGKTDDGRTFIVMAYYEGETLRARMARGPMPAGDAIRIGRQIAQGLARAHERGIVHRDVKPANIFITTDGTAKVLDFGVARLLDETHTQMTRAGTTIGTVNYMAPEQARGEEVDRRADVWALGVILHEMLTGAPTFGGDHPMVVLNAIQTQDPAPLDGRRPDVPAAVSSVVAQALKKERSERFADAGALEAALAAADAPRDSTPVPAPAAAGSALRRPLVAVPLGLALIALLSISGWLLYAQRRASWARNQALPEIARLADDRKFAEAVALAETAEPYLPGDPVLASLWTRIAIAITVDTNPSGAQVESRRYADLAATWQTLGTTPLKSVRVPRGTYKWRFSKTGSEAVERAYPAGAGAVRIDLPAAGSVPAGYVKIPKSSEYVELAAFGLPQEVSLDEYFIQRYEVTNREFKKFVDAGGYRRQEFWTVGFTEKDRTLTFDEAVARFRDKTGQPGPSTWEVSAYPAGQDELPVAGVSWYEALAYTQFAGASLPTIAHWYRAAGVSAGPYLIPLANFDYRGPQVVGGSGAMSPSGAFDMAGNVKEWAWNQTTTGERYTLGGGAGDPTYLYGEPEPRSPWDRGPVNGLRCVKYPGGQPDARNAAPFNRLVRDYRRDAPVSDEVFAGFLRQQRYPPRPLEARTEKTIDTDPAIRVERVTFTAPYANDRVIAYIWLPKTLTPPYQTLVVFPGSEGLRPAGPDALERPDRYDFLVQSGRAVVHPIYIGMYERFHPGTPDPISIRDRSIQWAQEVQRTIDYLETRADIDRGKIGYFGVSLGAGFAPIALAREPRLKVAVLMGAGLLSRKNEPEAEPVNYLPRVTQPVLMVNGIYDYLIPRDPAQRRFFELLGSKDKQPVEINSSHAVPRADYLPPVLGWLDKYFGRAR